MDKEYVLTMLEQRISTLKQRYRFACHGKDDDGNVISNHAHIRHVSKKELNMCMLIEELIVATPGKLVNLSEEAIEAIEKLVEPIERHRRLK